MLEPYQKEVKGCLVLQNVSYFTSNMKLSLCFPYVFYIQIFVHEK